MTTWKTKTLVIWLMSWMLGTLRNQFWTWPLLLMNLIRGSNIHNFNLKMFLKLDWPILSDREFTRKSLKTFILTKKSIEQHLIKVWKVQILTQLFMISLISSKILKTLIETFSLQLNSEFSNLQKDPSHCSLKKRKNWNQWRKQKMFWLLNHRVRNNLRLRSLINEIQGWTF